MCSTVVFSNYEEQLMEERLIGFDAREMWLSFDWDPQRRQTYLLREEIEKPLSTDTMVWKQALDLCQIDPPSWTGVNDLWDDMDRLREFVGKHKTLLYPFWLIAITWLSDNPESYSAKYDCRYLCPVRPAQIDPLWELLGYDVSDMFLLSGLSNCGYTAPDDIFALRASFAGKINRFHLFDSLCDAQKFRDFTDQRVKEHASFSVYGVYQIKSQIGR